MQSPRIVKAFNEGEQVASRLIAAGVGAVMYELGLERMKEALGRCIVEGVTTPAHRTDDARRGEVGLEDF